MKNDREFRDAVFEKARAYKSLKKQKSKAFARTALAIFLFLAIAVSVIYIPLSAIPGDVGTAGGHGTTTGEGYTGAYTTEAAATTTAFQSTWATQGPAGVYHQNWIIWMDNDAYGVNRQPYGRKVYACLNSEWSGEEDFVSDVAVVRDTDGITDDMRNSCGHLPVFDTFDGEFFSEYVFVYITVNSGYVPASVLCEEDEDGKRIEVGVVDRSIGQGEMATYTVIVQYPKQEIAEGEEISVAGKFYE